MNNLSAIAVETATPTAGALAPLSALQVGDHGVIVEVRSDDSSRDHGVDAAELQRRLLEFGFVEGARVEVLHEGAIRHDPIAVKLDDMRVALRRRDARDILVLLDSPRP